MDDALAAFGAVDIRAGTIVAAEPFPEARKPAFKITVDFGPQIGLKTSSAQLTAHYSCDELAGLQIIAVVNLPPRRVAGFSSDVLILGLPDESGGVILARPDRRVENGAKLF